MDVTWAQGICLICIPKAQEMQAQGLKAFTDMWLGSLKKILFNFNKVLALLYQQVNSQKTLVKFCLHAFCFMIIHIIFLKNKVHCNLLNTRCIRLLAAVPATYNYNCKSN